MAVSDIMEGPDPARRWLIIGLIGAFVLMGLATAVAVIGGIAP
jgi:hypothetical protein